MWKIPDADLGLPLLDHRDVEREDWLFSDWIGCLDFWVETWGRDNTHADHHVKERVAKQHKTEEAKYSIRLLIPIHWWLPWFTFTTEIVISHKRKVLSAKQVLPRVQSTQQSTIFTKEQFDNLNPIDSHLPLTHPNTYTLTHLHQNHEIIHPHPPPPSLPISHHGTTNTRSNHDTSSKICFAKTTTIDLPSRRTQKQNEGECIFWVQW